MKAINFPDRRRILRRSTNIVPVDHKVTRANRHAVAGHRSGVLWFTGLSAAGKTTLALALEQRLFESGYLVYVLDGDNVRNGLNADLGFSAEDRAENIRRVGELAALFADAGFIVITAFISPYRAERERARLAVGEAFHEIYIAADLATCERRDPKGLYSRARAGTIDNFTGISAPYEAPEAAELIVDTAKLSVEKSLARLVEYVEKYFVRVSRRSAPEAG
jgi:bifunctional enzyme CysN/CysC